MSATPHEIQLALAEFDRSQLPIDQRELTGEAFALAVRDHLHQTFAGTAGHAQIAITSDRIIIRWDESDSPATVTERGIDRLKASDYVAGIPLLERALQQSPDDATARLNLAIALSDQNRLPEAIGHALALLEEEPGHVGAWVTLGVAQARAGKTREALDAFRAAVDLDPNEGHALKNLGAMLAQQGQDLDLAADCLARAAMLLPDDPPVWFNLGKLCHHKGETIAANKAYQRVIDLNPASAIADAARDSQSKLASEAFKEEGKGQVNADAVAYCLAALRLFADMPKARVQEITFEIGMRGADGLDLMSPTKNHALRTLPGSFSALELLCLQYVGFQSIDPSVDTGLDLSAEYAAAKRLFDGAPPR
jgi:tetratricopeptide (TPR) repeat protein